MKTLKTITGIALMSILSFTSCQNEVDDVQGENPNTNAVNSTTAINLKRTSMYDGSFDDFLDKNSCSSVLLPVIAKVNGIQVSVSSKLDYQKVIDILAQFNNDDDTVVLQFPIRMRLSNHTEVTVNNQTEYNAIVNACGAAEESGKDAISCIKINFPITILTYNLSLAHTGSIVIQSEEHLYAYISKMKGEELFAISYPMTITFSNGTKATIKSNLELQASISECTSDEDIKEHAEENAKKLEAILVNGMFKVKSFVREGVDSANNYKDFTIDFANDLTVKATNTANATVATGTYKVSSELAVFLKLNLTENATLSLLNNTWKITGFTATSITLQSTTNANVTLVLTQI